MCRRLALLVFAALALSACAVNRYVVSPYDKLTLNATNDVNPDHHGRASPITVRVYELSSRTTFDNLDFNAAFNNAGTFLSDELLSSAERVLLPGETARHRVNLNRNARYIAVVAAYRDIDRAKWKLVYPVNGDWYYSHTLTFTSDGVVLGEIGEK
jgi:type VI secretion lipoprotein, VC_A0113 family